MKQRRGGWRRMPKRRTIDDSAGPICGVFKTHEETYWVRHPSEEQKRDPNWRPVLVQPRAESVEGSP